MRSGLDCAILGWWRAWARLACVCYYYSWPSYFLMTLALTRTGLVCVRALLCWHIEQSSLTFAKVLNRCASTDDVFMRRHVCRRTFRTSHLSQVALLKVTCSLPWFRDVKVCHAKQHNTRRSP